MIRDVTDLDVYNESLRLLQLLYIFLKKVPKSEYDTVGQLKRSAKSVPATIAEGFAKRSSAAEFKRYIMISIGSSDESVTHLRVLTITVPLITTEAIQLANEYRTLSKLLTS